MAINDMTVSDISTVANAVFSNALGGTASAAVSDFVTSAELVLKNQAYDPFNTALSQVLSKTIFSIRPYSGKFKGIVKDEIRWGNHVRKAQMVEEVPTALDGSFFDTDASFLAADDSVDQWKINAPEVLQTNFYGQGTYQKSMTVWKDQIDTALTGPQEFGNFLTMIMTHAADQLEQTRESLRRGTVANLIGGTILLADSNQVIHLLTEYNTLTGLTLTATSVYQPANYKPFMQFVYARIKTIMEGLTDRTVLYHLNPVVLSGTAGVQKMIARHTPVSFQHVYLLSDFVNKSEDMAIAETFHDSYLKRVDYETVNYWLNPASKSTISTTVNYLSAGTAGSSGAASAITSGSVSNSAVVGVIFDDEAAGFNPTRQHATVTPLNAKGLYTNYYWTETGRWWTDNTENCVVLCLD